MSEGHEVWASLIDTRDGLPIPLVKPTIFIGRASTCEVMLRDTSVSREHAMIVRSQGKVLIQDLQSANGTIVNDVRVTIPTELNTGDRISVGTRRLIFRLEDGSEAEDQAETMKLRF